MQTTDSLAAAQAIYGNTVLSPASKLDAMALLFGWNSAARTAARPAASTRRRGRSTTTRATARATTARPKTTARTRTRAAANTDSLREKVFNLIPPSGGIEQTKIRVSGYKPNLIGNALSRLQKAGRLVSQGPAGQKVWARAAAQQRAA